MKLSTTILLCVLCAIAAQAAQPTDYKSGITMTLGGTEGVDWKVEQPWHTPAAYDIPLIYIKSTTTIALSHNARNVATRLNSRNLYLIGVNGADGIAANGDEGQIRYHFDEMKSERYWYHATSSNKFRAYSTPITIGTEMTQDGLTAVLGNVGTLDSNKGMTDAAGDEYHVMCYADDDAGTGGHDEARASDGKYAVFCVNPKTPCITLSAIGTGQFYTTPVYTLYSPRLFAQTSYVSADVTFTITDLEDADITYRIDGGAWTTTTSPATINSSAFSTGTHTLEYKSERGISPVKTRTVVKNPTHPYTGVSWSVEYQAEVAWRRNNAPFKATHDLELNRLPGYAASWAAVGGQGYRLGGRLIMNGLPVQNPQIVGTTADNFATFGRVIGYDAVVGASTYGRLAKEMALDSWLNIPNIGIRRQQFSSDSVPCSEVWYRGYWDILGALSVAKAYEKLSADFKDSQNADGMTAIESYFIRDRLADFVYRTQALLGGWAFTSIAAAQQGMWFTAWHVAAMEVVCGPLSTYSSPYYGTSGIDGNTAVWTFLPYESAGYTWKTTLLTHDHAKASSLFAGPVVYSGFRDALAQSPLAKADGSWGDNLTYFSWTGMGGHLAQYWNLKATYDPAGLAAIDNVRLLIDLATKSPGVIGSKGSNLGPMRFAQIGNLNSKHPTASANANAWIQSLPSTDPNSDDKLVSDAGWLVDYDHDYYGGTVPETPPADPSGLTLSVLSNSSIRLNWTDNASNETYYQVDRGTDGTNWPNTVQIAANSNSYVATGLAGGTLYYFRVRAGNTEHTSAYISGSATTNADEVAPPPPTTNTRKPGRMSGRGAKGPL